MYIKRKIKKGKLKNKIGVKGLEIKPSIKGNIEIKKVTICDKEISNNYIRKKLDKRFKKLYKTIYDFLISDDESEEGIKVCLGEIEKIKQVIFNKYKEHMKNKLYKEFLAKIVLTENEFKEKYKEREYYTNMIKNTFKNYVPYEEEIRGKSR